MDEKIKDAQLLIRLSKKDLAQIKKNAAACNQTVSSYVRDSALNMCVVPIDVGIIDSYKEEIQGYRNAIICYFFCEETSHSSIDTGLPLLTIVDCETV